MASISIIGTGKMGSAIHDLLRRGGNPVQLVGHDDDAVEVVGDIVVLAVRHPVVKDVVARRREQLAHKVVVDISNAVDFANLDAVTVDPAGSAAADLAAALPDSRVVKAFNTNFSATLVSGRVGAVPTRVLVCGDDAAAKTLVGDAVRSGGLDVVDVGGLARARELEAIGFLQITLAVSGKIPWTGGFTLT